jgi:hypothetical protein
VEVGAARYVAEAVLELLEPLVDLARQLDEAVVATSCGTTTRDMIEMLGDRPDNPSALRLDPAMPTTSRGWLHPSRVFQPVALVSMVSRQQVTVKRL